MAMMADSQLLGLSDSSSSPMANSPPNAPLQKKPLVTTCLCSPTTFTPQKVSFKKHTWFCGAYNLSKSNSKLLAYLKLDKNRSVKHKFLELVFFLDEQQVGYILCEYTVAPSPRVMYVRGVSVNESHRSLGLSKYFLHAFTKICVEGLKFECKTRKIDKILLCLALLKGGWRLINDAKGCRVKLIRVINEDNGNDADDHTTIFSIDKGLSGVYSKTFCRKQKIRVLKNEEEYQQFIKGKEVSTTEVRVATVFGWTEGGWDAEEFVLTNMCGACFLRIVDATVENFHDLLKEEKSRLV